MDDHKAQDESQDLIDFEVDETLKVRVTNVGPEDDIVITALALGNLITDLMRKVALDTDADDEVDPDESDA